MSAVSQSSNTYLKVADVESRDVFDNSNNEPLETIIRKNVVFKASNQQILQSSIPKEENKNQSLYDSLVHSFNSNFNTSIDQKRYRAGNFFDTCIEAYNMHIDLKLDPNQVWIAVVQQFSLYVNAHAEDLRDKFVDFKGKKKLTVVTKGSTTDYAIIIKKMVEEKLKESLKDPSVVDWLIPNFSTTTETDRMVGWSSIMGVLEKYHRYEVLTLCGLPSVTLTGTVDDWIDIKKRADKLLEYDVDGLMKKWHALLSPILDEFIATKKGKGNPKWWNKICHVNSESGSKKLSGWLTAFALFNDKGELAENRNRSNDSVWPVFEMRDLPSGILSVPLEIREPAIDLEIDADLLCGFFAMSIDHKSTITPQLDWVLTIPDDEPKHLKKKQKK